jgi:hypothetical protein
MATTKPFKKIISRLIILSLFIFSVLITYKLTNEKSHITATVNLSSPLNTDKIEIGSFTGTNPPTISAVEMIEKISGRKQYSIMWYEGWNANNQPEFPRSALDKIASKKINKIPFVLHLTWEPDVALKDIVKGTHDDYIATYAESIKDWGGEIRLRVAHEMIQDNVLNGEEFYRWQDQPEDYVNAFRHVHDIFTQAGASNAKFVWCPNNHPADINIVKQYYPGVDYVDWLCMDGYNWGNRDGKPGWPDWMWFDDIFANIYHTFVDHPEIFGDKPIMLGEFASCEASPHDLEGQHKAEWIKNAFERIASPDFGKIKAFHWFQINKECDWRVNSSDSAKVAFKAALKNKRFISNP